MASQPTKIVKSVEIANDYNYPTNRLNMRERKVLEVANTYVPAVPANWAVQPANQDAALDALAAGGAATINQVVSAVYDFSVSGGAVGTITLPVTLPNKAVVLSVYRDVVTPVTSTGSTGTVLLGLPTDGALEQTALTANGAAISVASTAGTAAPKKTTAARAVQVTIGTNPVLAGKINYIIHYYVSI